uniref:Exodeoxyribonuclease 1 n=1 Tax=Mycena chlorophos TaxID=658473 RepID=A0ABQ0M7I6_MYCCL|nr:exodeoxyribonuclease 1 [Mycena chlorophos]
MGISGLLPALKSISTRRHLSEFAGQTLGVDAYVWLHRGIFTCATQLATGKETTKYVDYAMHRVRLLRHHGIEPYIVFDGGPLPAKKGTEGDRQARRAEHLALGNALAAQGKSTQAREHYVKCVDVTPQMAKQLIKALQAEGISYIVAPYEADAQLAYLEAQGIISGIITEDSDLLVFGCRNVLYKMDAVSATAECISQADFPRITSDGISLHGFSLAQFRAMAILSGCDYLPSIPGIGLKTACSLLRKWRTAEQVVRVIRMEGKKSVPRGYLDNFRLAEKCFLHQRVYDPVNERLIHLTEPDGELDEAANAYVGPDMNPALAKRVAVGDADPISLRPMVDICPSFVPRVLKPLPFVVNGVGRKANDKGKGKATILSFFAPAKPGAPSRAPVVPIINSVPGGMVVGKASGKRSLAEEVDRDIAAKRKRLDEESRGAQSRFFPSSRQGNAGSRPLEVDGEEIEELVAGPSRLRGKENVPLDDEEDEEVVLEVEEDLEADLQWDSLSLMALSGCNGDVAEPQVEPEVEQEEGYISPTPSRSRDTEDLSSPIRPTDTPRSQKRMKLEKDVAGTESEVDLDVLSSPPDAPARRVPLLNLNVFRYSGLQPEGNVLVAASPEREGLLGADVDLLDSFGDERTSDIDCFEDDKTGDDDDEEEEEETEPPLAVEESATPTPSPPTPFDGDMEERAALESAARAEVVAAGWRDRWALSKDAGRVGLSTMRPPGGLRRRETTITPTGRHFPIGRAIRQHLHAQADASVPARSKPGSGKVKQTPLQSRRSLTFFDPMPMKPKGTGTSSRGRVSLPADGGDLSRGPNRFAQFSYS